MTKLIYDADIDATALEWPARGGHRLRQPGRGARAQPVRVGAGRGRRAAPGLELRRARARGRAARHRCRIRHRGGTRGDGAGARHRRAVGLPRRDRAEPARRVAPDVRARLQHPLRRDRPAGRRRRRDGGPEGAGAHRAPAVHRRRRRPGPLRRPSRRHGHGPAADARLCPWHRLRSSRRAGDDVRRGDRDRPVRRAGRSVRRHDRPGAGRLRDPRRGRLPAGARLLRDDARAEAHRRSHVPGRPVVHALLDQRHGRVRRLRVRRPHHQRGDARRDEADPGRDPGRVVRPALDRRGQARRARVQAAARRARASAASRRSVASCAATWPSSIRRARPRAGPTATGPRPRQRRARASPDGQRHQGLRHDAARRGADAGRLADRRREGERREAARAAAGRRHRGGLSGGIPRRGRGGEAHRERGRWRDRSAGDRRAGALRPGRRDDRGGGARARAHGARSTSSSRRATSISPTSCAARVPRCSIASAPAWRRRDGWSDPTTRSSSAPRTLRAPRSPSCSRPSRRPSPQAHRSSTCPTPSATPSRRSSAGWCGRWSSSSVAVRSSAPTATTISASPRPIPLPASRPEPARSRSRSTGSASAPATPRSKRWSWRCGRGRASSEARRPTSPTSRSRATSRLASYLTGIPVQPNKSIVGANAFAHESGIHQDGFLKNPLTYEIMTPESVGLSGSTLTLGKLSGRAGFDERLQTAGDPRRARRARSTVRRGDQPRGPQEAGDRCRPARARGAARRSGSRARRARALGDGEPAGRVEQRKRLDLLWRTDLPRLLRRQRSGRRAPLRG